MSETIARSARVPETLAGRRLDRIAAELFPEFSRARLQTWIKSGELQVNGQAMRPRDPLMGGDQLELAAQTTAETGHWQAESIRLDIVHEDNSLLVINKAAGLVVHPAAGNQQGTLVNGLLHHCPDLEAIPRAGIVHRLDKDTTGLMVVAKTLAAHNALVRQLQERSVDREYQAVACGVMTAGGTVDEPLDRHPVNRKKRTVRSGGKPAVTHYRVLERYRRHSLLRVKLETGRTHQIRVHMAHIRHPLVGDPVYGGRLQIPAGCSEELEQQLRRFRRQALHAYSLGFVHPDDGVHCSWEVAAPADMQDLIAALRTDAEAEELLR